MKCIILAAGKSERLRPLTNDIPKCLLEVGGKTILQRIIESVIAVGVAEIGIVLGYKAELVRTFVRRRFPSHRKIQFIANPKYEMTNNAFSLLMAREFYRSDKKRSMPSQELLLLDSDILFSQALLKHLFEQSARNTIAIRRSAEHNAEEIKVHVDENGNVLRIGKEVALSETYGESIGIELFSPSACDLLFDTLERRVRSGEGRAEFYEAAFQEMIDNGTVFTAVDVSRFPCAEIDTSSDLEYARATLVRMIDGEREE
jgi:choline kinase